MLSRRAVLTTGLAATIVPQAAVAQIPPPPYAYIRGTDIARDFLSTSKVPLSKGLPDLWLRANFRNLGYYLKRPGWGLYIKHMILRTTGGPYHQWDTLPTSSYPLLLVESGTAGRINRMDGSIAGFSPPDDASIDLFIADNAGIITRHVPIELETMTMDGPYVITVALANMGDVKPL
jgi:hypothetical protein